MRLCLIELHITTRYILYKDIPAPFNIREQICKYVKWHGLPLWPHDRNGYDHEIVKASLHINNNILAMIATADVKGRYCDDKNENLERIEFFRMQAKELGCYNKPKGFETPLSRYTYLQNKGTWIDYVPFPEDKFTVYMMVGIPGAGKDTIAKKLFGEIPIVSVDDIRRELKIDPKDKKANGKTYQEVQERCRILMRGNNSFCFNATNINKDVRSKWIGLFKEYGGKIEMIYVEVPYKEIVKRNLEREHPVPLKIVDKMIRKLEMPEFDEAFTICEHINKMNKN